MSTSKETTVWCDTAGCYTWETYPVSTQTEARKRARSEGWSNRGKVDLCPPCAQDKCPCRIGEIGEYCWGERLPGQIHCKVHGRA